MSDNHDQSELQNRQLSGIILTDAERLQAEIAAEDKERRRADDSFKARQIGISELQTKLAQYTLILGVAVGLITAYAVVISKQSADAAIVAANTAKATLDQMKASGEEDTQHALAVIDKLERAAISLQAGVENNRSMMESTLKQGRDALETTRRAFQAEQRPFVVIDGPIFTADSGPAPEKPIKANITTRNIGKTPAFDAAMYATFVRFPNRAFSTADDIRHFIDTTFEKLHQKAKMAYTAEERRMTLFFRSDIVPTDSTFFTEVLSDSPLSTEEFTALTDGKISLLYATLVVYADSFGHLYSTERCRTYFGTDPSTWHLCPTHNSAR